MKELLLVFGFVFQASASPNCYVYRENEACYNACREAEIATNYYQGSKLSQQHFDKSIDLCETFDYAYYEKAVPFAKRGLINEWKPLLDKALALNPGKYLGVRGWYHFFFMRNYSSAIEDIERLDSLVDYNIGYTGDGLYHLLFLKGLSLKGMGNFEEAISVITDYMSDETYDPNMYDYLHLGVLYMDVHKYDLARKAFAKQREVNDISEIYYYEALLNEKLGDYSKAEQLLSVSLERYNNHLKMSNEYVQLMDVIYEKDIKNALARIHDLKR